MEHLIKKALSSLYAVELTSVEKQIAKESITDKYAPATTRGITVGLLATPAIIFLDTSVIVTVLIPATLVAGTAWFSVSLANLKKKFEPFGLELTYNLFEAFVSSLIILFLASAFSLTSSLWGASAEIIVSDHPWLIPTAALLGTLGVGSLLYKIFLGAMKYDVNDAMLTGQNEAAERFFKKSLSLLHGTAASLRSHQLTLQVANYFTGVSFYEIYSNVKKLSKNTEQANQAAKMLERANSLINHPDMSQAKADAISRELINAFITLMSKRDEVQNHKSTIAIQDEYQNLIKEDSQEDQAMIDTRTSVVFEEIATLIDEFGERLFV